MHYEMVRTVKNIIVLLSWKLAKHKNILCGDATCNFEDTQLVGDTHREKLCLIQSSTRIAKQLLGCFWPFSYVYTIS